MRWRASREMCAIESDRLKVLERMGRAEDAIKVAMLADSMARTPEERGAASAALAGARQFQISQKKMKELEEAHTSSESSSQTYSPEHKENALSGSSPLAVLTDTMGVDFNPYLARVLHDVKQNWYNLIPESAQWKKGRVVLEFFILKDGSVAGLKVVGSSGDVAMDRPAFGSITGSNPFPPLPREFPGPYLGLRFSYYYNLNTDGTPISQKNLPFVGRECTAEDYLTTSISSDGGTSLSIWPSEPVKVTLNKQQRFLLTEGNTAVAIANWAITGDLCKIADCGTVSELGLYTAPATMPPSPRSC